MGIRFTLFRSFGQRLCGGRPIDVPQTASVGAAGAGRRCAAIAPRLAVRAGVDATTREEPDFTAEEAMLSKADASEVAEAEQQRPAKRAKRDKERKPQPPRPNHFLALQVSKHPEICAAIAQVHSCLAQRAPHLKKACVDPASAHLTLGVMALQGEADRERAGQVLAGLAAPLAQAELLQPLEVRLEGLSHFRNQVLYLDIVQDRGLEQLLELAAVARAHFQEAGLLLEADRPLVPHVTVAKTSKLQGGRGAGGGRWARGRGAGGGRHGHGGGEHAHEQGWGRERRADRRGREEGLEGSLVGQADSLMDGAVGGLEQRAESPAAAAGAAKSTQGAGQADVEALPGSAGGLLPSKPAAAAVDSRSAGDAAETSSDGHALAAAAGNLAGAELLAGDPGDAGTSAAQQKRQEQQAQQAQQAQQQHEPAPQGWRQIPAEAWAPLAAIVGGTAVLAEVQLCAMQGRKPGGYYPVLCSLPLLPRPDLASSGAGSGDGSAD